MAVFRVSPEVMCNFAFLMLPDDDIRASSYVVIVLAGKSGRKSHFIHQDWPTGKCALPVLVPYAGTYHVDVTEIWNYLPFETGQTEYHAVAMDEKNNRSP